MTQIMIYARYSSDLQSKLSNEDQALMIKKYIHENFNDYSIENIIFDDESTGKNLERHGINKIINLSYLNLFNIILCESLDRISRKIADTAHFYDIMTFNNIKIITLQEGLICDIHIALLGAMNQKYLTDMKHKIKRGHTAKVHRGESPAGIAYGYKKANYVNDNGDYITGQRQIDDDKAKIVIYIFNEYASGKGIKTIAKNLNDMGVPSPSGKTWKPTSLLGSKNIQAGILNNEIYIGNIVYNKTSKKVDPRTNKTITIANPKDDWVIDKNENYRIISDELWLKVKEMQINKKQSQQFKNGHNIKKKYNSRPFTHLISCGVCNSVKTIGNRSRYICNNYRYHRTCDNARGMTEQKILLHFIHYLYDFVNNDDIQFMPIFIKELANENKRIENLINDRKILEEQLGEYIDAIAYKVAGAIKKSKEIEDKITNINSELSNYRKMPDDENEIKFYFSAVIKEIEYRFFDKDYSKTIALLIKLIVHEIKLIPKSSPSGEIIEITLKDNWVDFYYQAKKMGFID